jgi:predicted transcriptional regulator
VPSRPEARYPILVGAARHTAKETVRRLLDDLPDNASLEDIQYHIYVREKIERGLRDVEAGRVVDQNEAKRRMAKVALALARSTWNRCRCQPVQQPTRRHHPPRIERS